MACKGIAVPAVVPGIQIGVGELLGHTPEHILHGLAPPNKDGFLLGTVKGALAIRKLVPEVHFAGCVTHHSVEKQPGVLGDGGLPCGGQRSLGNIKDTLDVDADTLGAILSGVGISGFHKENTGFSFADIASPATPEVGLAQIGGIRLLGSYQQSVADGIPLEFGLHI